MRRCLAGLALVLAVVSPAFAFLPPFFVDAPLRAVHFIDRNQGLAVGDHGVVWMTLDGGKTWDRSKTGSKASLSAVSFVDPLQGWAVGRIEKPNGNSVGVVLVSNDGGLSWSEVNTTSLPGLNTVKFFDERTGLATGDVTASSPSGIFATADGGKTWLAVSGAQSGTWTCAEFTNLSNGVLGGPGGNLGGYSKGQIQNCAPESSKNNAVRAFAFQDKDGIAACDGGIALKTDDGGAKWDAVNLGLSEDVLKCLDFRAATRAGDHIWLAGRPGSAILHSSNRGKTWAIQKTGWNLPINSLCAVNDTEVFAVGEFGAILKTTDSGATWKLLRCGGQRAAVLFANFDPSRVPYDSLAVLGVKDGYLATSLTLKDSGRATDEFRHTSAVRTAGGASADSIAKFPFQTLWNETKSDELIAHWKREHGGEPEEELLRQLVLAIRIWTPEVIASDLLDSSTGPAEQSTLVAIKKAFKLAEDAKAFPEQLETLGLKAFAPKKLYAMEPERSKSAEVKQDQTAYATLLGSTPQGYTEPAFALWGESYSPPLVRPYRLLSHRVPGSEKHEMLTSGFDFAEGGPARRRLPQFNLGRDDFDKKAKDWADQRRTLETVILGADTPQALEKAIGLASSTFKKMPDDMACRTAVGLGRQLAAQGKWVSARELFLIAVDRYGDFAESGEAIRWLMRYYTSAEARRRAEKENTLTLQYSTMAPSKTGIQQTGLAQPESGPRFSEAEGQQLWCKACTELEPKLAGFGSEFRRDPNCVLTLASAKRQLGRSGDAATILAEAFKSANARAAYKPGADDFRDCLAAEIWLNNREAFPTAPKPFAFCPKSGVKPHLDGKIDDDCWKDLKPISLANGGELKGYSTKAYFLHDEDYLYFAVECTHPEGKAKPKAEKRKRDDDLTGFDRVEILLDLDRDYQSYYRLRVDQRSCVADDCTGDASWNPKWFVAVEPTETGWTAEIAIPRSELTGANFKAGSTWGMNATRVIPGVGCQSWSGPADAKVRPEGMGLMQFHDAKK